MKYHKNLERFRQVAKILMMGVLFMITLSFLSLFFAPDSFQFVDDFEQDENESTIHTADGYISTNTTWTLTGSPYIISGHLVIEESATLTIEPGVSVKFAGEYFLIIDGTLNAHGTENAPIIFTSNSSIPAKGDWNGLKFRDSSPDFGSTLEWVSFSYASAAIILDESSQSATNCVFNNNSRGIQLIPDSEKIKLSKCELTHNDYGIIGSGYHNKFFLDDCVLTDNNYGLSGGAYSTLNITRTYIAFNNYGLSFGGSGSPSTTITACIIHNNSYGMYIKGQGGNNIDSCRVYNNTYGIYINGAYASYGSATITNSDFYDNDYGVRGERDCGSLSMFNSSIYRNRLLGVSAPGMLTISRCVIINNHGVGIQANNGGNIHNSSIYGNSPYDIEVLSGEDISADNNYWGTTNLSLLETHIFDYYDDYEKGEVYYSPIRPSFPTIIGPSNMTFQEGSVGHEIKWTANDLNPTSYSITNNSVEIEVGKWRDGQSFTVRLDSLTYGIYTFNLTVEDSDGNNASSVVVVNVLDKSCPNIDIIFPLQNDVFSSNSPNFNVKITDLRLNTTWYSLNGRQNITFIYNGTINQTEWNFLSEGDVALTFYANDIAGNIDSKSINIIKDITAPHILNAAYSNATGKILWSAEDKNPASYIIYKGDREIDSGSWDSGSQNIYAVKEIGSYNLTIFDSAGYMDSVLINVSSIPPQNLGGNGIPGYPMLIFSPLALIGMVAALGLLYQKAIIRPSC